MIDLHPLPIKDEEVAAFPLAAENAEKALRAYREGVPFHSFTCEENPSFAIYLRDFEYAPKVIAHKLMSRVAGGMLMHNPEKAILVMDLLMRECLALRAELDAIGESNRFLEAKVTAGIQRIEEQEQSHAELLEKIAQLSLQHGLLKQKFYGNGQSEKREKSQDESSREQENATSKDTDEGAAPATSSQVSPRPKNPVRKRRTRQENFENIPVVEVREIIPDEVLANPDAYECIGAESSFEVGVIPSMPFRREIRRLKYRLRHDRTAPPVIAPAPKRTISGGYPAPELLAYVVTSKFVDHLPLYRLEAIFERQGVRIPRNTMCDWLREISTTVEPVYKLMRAGILDKGYIQVDETPVRYIDGEEKNGKTKTGQMWVVNDPDGDVAFGWSPSRGLPALKEQLGCDFKGLLQSDGYAAYESLAREDEKITRLGCWAHARRKFYEARGESPELSNQFLDTIGELYALEKKWDETGLRADERSRMRLESFPKIFDRIHALAQETLKHIVRPKSALGRACSYMLGQWEALVAHLHHGHTRIDNNLTENAIRPSAIGKKNWLFIGDKDVGDRAAILYSLVISCRRRGIDPFEYMTDILSRLPRMTTKMDLSVLLPANWSRASDRFRLHAHTMPCGSPPANQCQPKAWSTLRV